MRAHLTKQVIRKVSGTPSDGACEVFIAGTATDLPDTIYSADTGAGSRTNPFNFTNGVVDFFLDRAQRVKLVITPTGGSAQTFDNVDVPEPAGIRRPYTRQYLNRSA